MLWPENQRLNLWDLARQVPLDIGFFDPEHPSVARQPDTPLTIFRYGINRVVVETVAAPQNIYFVAVQTNESVAISPQPDHSVGVGVYVHHVAAFNPEPLADRHEALVFPACNPRFGREPQPALGVFGDPAHNARGKAIGYGIGVDMTVDDTVDTASLRAHPEPAASVDKQGTDRIV